MKTKPFEAMTKKELLHEANRFFNMAVELQERIVNPPISESYEQARERFIAEGMEAGIRKAYPEGFEAGWRACRMVIRLDLPVD